VALVILESNRGHLAHWVIAFGAKGMQKEKKFDPAAPRSRRTGLSLLRLQRAARYLASRLDPGSIHLGGARESRLYCLGGCVILRSGWPGDLK